MEEGGGDSADNDPKRKETCSYIKGFFSYVIFYFLFICFGEKEKLKCIFTILEEQKNEK